MSDFLFFNWISCTYRMRLRTNCISWIERICLKEIMQTLSNKLQEGKAEVQDVFVGPKVSICVSFPQCVYGAIYESGKQTSLVGPKESMCNLSEKQNTFIIFLKEMHYLELNDM